VHQPHKFSANCYITTTSSRRFTPDNLSTQLKKSVSTKLCQIIFTVHDCYGPHREQNFSLLPAQKTLFLCCAERPLPSLRGGSGLEPGVCQSIILTCLQVALCFYKANFTILSYLVRFYNSSFLAKNIKGDRQTRRLSRLTFPCLISMAGSRSQGES
jgi:hypothetical protein